MVETQNKPMEQPKEKVYTVNYTETELIRAINRLAESQTVKTYLDTVNGQKDYEEYVALKAVLDAKQE